jgi:hypothetical protein
MSEGPESRLTVRQADQARTDFAAIEAHLEFLMHQMAQLGPAGSMRPAYTARGCSSPSLYNSGFLSSSLWVA